MKVPKTKDQKKSEKVGQKAKSIYLVMKHSLVLLNENDVKELVSIIKDKYQLPEGIFKQANVGKKKQIILAISEKLDVTEKTKLLTNIIDKLKKRIEKPLIIERNKITESYIKGFRLGKEAMQKKKNIEA